MHRHTGLDLFKVISMFFIVMLHYLGVGGSYFNVETGGLSGLNSGFYFANLFEALAIIGVNCFVLISGYFMVNSHFSWKKVIRIVIDTTIISVLIMLFTLPFGFSSWFLILKSIFPIVLASYWFISIYLFMYILSPYMNKLINIISKKEHFILIIILVIAFSFWNTFLLPWTPYLNFSGFSITWFLTLYIIGSYIFKYDLRFFKHNRWNFILYFICSILIFSSKISMIFLAKWIPPLLSGQNIFYHYDSVLTLAGSIFLFLGFKDLHLKENRFISKLSSLTLFVYLIHEHPIFREILWIDILKAPSFISSPYFIMHFIFSTIVVFVGCMIIGYLYHLISRIVIKKFERKKTNE